MIGEWRSGAEHDRWSALARITGWRCTFIHLFLTFFLSIRYTDKFGSHMRHGYFIPIGRVEVTGMDGYQRLCLSTAQGVVYSM